MIALRLFCATIVAGALAVPSALAEAHNDAKLQLGYQRCIDRSEGIATKQHECMKNELRRLDRLLNVEIEKMLKRSTPALAGSWNVAHRNWLNYRRTECEFAAAVEQNGLGVGMWVDIAYGCEMDMTSARAKSFSESVIATAYHSTEFDRCSAVKLGRCFDDESARLDKDLNRAYRNLIATVKKDDDERWRAWYIDALRKSERAWLAYRDSECDLAAARTAAAGSSEKAARDMCRLTLLSDRAQELRDRVADVDGH